MIWKLVIEEYDDKPDGTLYEFASYADLGSFVDTIKSNRELDLRKAIKATVYDPNGRKVFALDRLTLTREYRLVYLPSNA